MKKIVKFILKWFVWQPLSTWGLFCPKCGSRKVNEIGTYDAEYDTTFPNEGDYNACQNCGYSW